MEQPGSGYVILSELNWDLSNARARNKIEASFNNGGLCVGII